MQLKIKDPLWQVVGLGVLAGMRSASAPAITSHILSHHQSKKFGNSPLGFMQSNTTANILKILAVGEFIGDKLPAAPNRIKASALIARCVSGALVGASIYKASGNNPYTGALIGTATACASTFGSFFLRKATVKKTHIFDPLIGALEDSLVIGAGIGLA